MANRKRCESCAPGLPCLLHAEVHRDPSHEDVPVAKRQDEKRRRFEEPIGHGHAPRAREPDMFMVLARPYDDDDDDEPPVLTIEDTLPAAHRAARSMGGALIERRIDSGRDEDGVPLFEHGEFITPRHLEVHRD